MKTYLKKFGADDSGAMNEIGLIVGILVTCIVAILVFYNIAGSIDTTSIDADLTGTPAANATDATLDQAATVFTIVPIIAIVVVAVVILGYISRVGG